MNDARYIVVMFFHGIGHTLQTDDKPHIFFSKSPKSYKKLGSAVKRANKLFYQYYNDRICVFKVSLGERLSCDQYEDWCKDKNRLVWNSNEAFS